MKIRKLLTIVLSLVFLGSASMLVLKQRDYKQGAQDHLDAMQAAGLQTPASPAASAAPSEGDADATVDTPEEPPQPGAEELLAQIDLAALRQTNPEVTGWIMIPGTSISYPVLRAADNDYYLTHTWKGERSSVGAIFLDCRTGEADFNTFVYGHRMRNGTMFAELKYYNTLDKWQECPDVYLMSDTGVQCWRIFAAYEAETDAPVYKPGELTERQKEAVLNYALTKSWIDTEIVPTTEDRILTLVTCTGDGYSARWVVQAVLQTE